MSIITPAEWMTYANRTFTGGQLAQLTQICTAVDSAVKKYLQRTLEYASFSFILSAPRTNQIQLFKQTPIYISSFNLYLNWYANGNPTQFTSSSLLTPYVDYLLEPDQSDPTVSSNGVVQYLQGGVWGLSFFKPVYTVASKRINNPGAIQVVFNGGYHTDGVTDVVLPPDITLAACMAVSRVLNTPRYGVQPLGESWDGYSYSLMSIIQGILGSPDIAGLLNPYRNMAACIA